MKTKISLANMQGKLSRAEMKNVMGGMLAPMSCLTSCGTWTCDATGSYKSGTCTIIN